MSIHTNPPGAAVWRKSYDAPDSTWIMLGKTPLDSVLLALRGSGGLFLNSNRLRIEAPGYRTLELTGMPFSDSVLRLDRDGAIPPEMVRVARRTPQLHYPGFEEVGPVALGDYLMDRYEVTNREFKLFVDSGGYRRRELWEEPFVKEGEAAVVGRGDGADDRSHRAARAVYLGRRRLSRRARTTIRSPA